jgi:MFS family permease
LMGIGVGGNLPVDGALFLEFLPAADNRLLTLLSAWWPLGQLAASLGKLLQRIAAAPAPNLQDQSLGHSSQAILAQRI